MQVCRPRFPTVPGSLMHFLIIHTCTVRCFCPGYVSVKHCRITRATPFPQTQRQNLALRSRVFSFSFLTFQRRSVCRPSHGQCHAAIRGNYEPRGAERKTEATAFREAVFIRARRVLRKRYIGKSTVTIAKVQTRLDW